MSHNSDSDKSASGSSSLLSSGDEALPRYCPLCLRMNSLAEAIIKPDLAVGNNIDKEKYK